MLQALRDKSSGWVATVVLGLLIIPFALFGINDYVSGGSQNYAARIQTPPAWWPGAPAAWPVNMLWGKHDIETREFRERFEQERQKARQEQGEAFDNKAFEAGENKRRILERMIDERLMRIAAEQAGVRIPDAAVRRQIESVPEFQVDGRFNARRYQALLAGLNPPTTPLRFEQSIRDDLQRNALLGQVYETAFVSDAAAKRILGLWFEQRDVDMAQVPLPAADAQVLAPAEVQAWFAKHGERYRTPETATLEYVEVDAAALAPAPIDEAQLRARYAEQRSKFGTAEQRLVSHLLVPVDAKAGAAAVQAAQRRAQQLQAQASAPGADFAALAKAQSGDPGSKGSGGDLGWLERDGSSLPKPFTDAAFALQPGAVSQPVKTDFGWHIIKLREVRAGTQKPFEAVRAQLEQELAGSARERAYNDLLTALVDELMKNPAGFAEIAAKHKLAIRRLGPVARGSGQSILAQPAVERDAFSSARIEDGSVSDPIEVAPGRSVLLRVVAHSPAKPQPLTAVRARVEADLRADKARRQAEQTVKALVAEMAKGKPLATLAAERGYAVIKLPGIVRMSSTPSPQAVEAIFRAPRPAAGRVSAGQFVLPDGSHAVFQVTAARAADPGAIPAQQQADMRKQLGAALGDQAARAYVGEMRKRLRIQVVERQL